MIAASAIAHTLRTGAIVSVTKSGFRVPLKSGLAASPSLSTTRPSRSSDLMISSSVCMAPTFIVSKPDKACSVLTALNLRVSSMTRAAVR